MDYFMLGRTNFAQIRYEVFMISELVLDYLKFIFIS